MAITALAYPQSYTPAYNPIKLIVDSTNKNNAGFKYIFQVENLFTTAQIADYRILPTFATGYGEQDFSKLFSSIPPLWFYYFTYIFIVFDVIPTPKHI